MRYILTLTPPKDSAALYIHLAQECFSSVSDNLYLKKSPLILPFVDLKQMMRKKLLHFGRKLNN